MERGRNFTFCLGAALIFNEAFYYWRLLYVGILCVLFTLLSLPQIIPQIKAYKRKKSQTTLGEERLQECAVAQTQEERERESNE